MRERIDEGSGERRSSRVGGQFSRNSVRIRDIQSRQTHMYFRIIVTQTHMHTVRIRNEFRSVRTVQEESPVACHASLIHHSVIPRLGLSVISVSHMT